MLADLSLVRERCKMLALATLDPLADQGER
jgi:hypothetical protein